MIYLSKDFVFDDFQSHASLPRTSTVTNLTVSLQEHHPDHHITPLCPRTIDLQAYATAGHATCSPYPDSPAVSTTSYTPPPLRLDQATDPGTLTSSPTFEKYIYKYSVTKFVLYKVVLTTTYGGQDIYLFLLTPSSPSSIRNPETNRPAATDALLLAAGKHTHELHSEILIFDAQQWRKDAALFKSVQATSWDSVILAPATKKAILSDVTGFFDAQELYTDLGVPWKRGLILHGPPGNGKTMTLKALMATLQRRDPPVPSLYVKSLEGCQKAQFAVRAIFERARRMAPCLLVLEDLDSLVTPEVRSYFLNEVDGLEENQGVCMIGSTNHLGKLDPAIRERPSRFDRKYGFRLPGFEERKAYVGMWRKKVLAKGKAKVEWGEGEAEVLSGWTEGFSFAYLKEAFVAGLLVIARGGTGEEKEEELAHDTGSSTPESGVVVEAPSDETEEKTPEPSTSAPEARPPQPERVDLTRHRKAAIADVPVPAELQNSILLRVMRQQIELLLSEMDNSNEGAADDKTVAKAKLVSGKEAANSTRMDELIQLKRMQANLRNIPRPTREMQAVPMSGGDQS